jgi:hypothetical protein
MTLAFAHHHATGVKAFLAFPAEQIDSVRVTHPTVQVIPLRDLRIKHEQQPSNIETSQLNETNRRHDKPANKQYDKHKTNKMLGFT